MSIWQAEIGASFATLSIEILGGVIGHVCNVGSLIFLYGGLANASGLESTSWTKSFG